MERQLKYFFILALLIFTGCAKLEYITQNSSSSVIIPLTVTGPLPSITASNFSSFVVTGDCEPTLGNVTLEFSAPLFSQSIPCPLSGTYSTNLNLSSVTSPSVLVQATQGSSVVTSTISNDQLAPTVSITPGAAVVTGTDATFTITIVENTSFSSFTPTVSSGSLTSPACTSSPCVVTVTGASVGELTLTVPAGSVVDPVGNSNALLTSASLPVNDIGSAIPGLNGYCAAQVISRTGCGGQTSMTAPVSGNVYNLVEIGGMCWFKDNLKEIPSNFNPAPLWVNNSNNGWHGFFNDNPTEFFVNEGRMYNFAAAVNEPLCVGVSGHSPACVAVERAQGACPAGYHVPSDCEWMALENALGMSTANQTNTFYRTSGSVGTQIKGAGSSSGFDILPVGVRLNNGVFDDGVTSETAYYSSTAFLGTDNISARRVRASNVGVRRINAASNSHAYRIRCLKN